MPFFWSFHTAGTYEARLNCWPVEPNSVVITCDGKTLTDDGDGNLVGDGDGTIDYSYGLITINFNAPYPTPGSQIIAKYDPVEGGCYLLCNKCATHRIRLEITPGAISGDGEQAIEEHWKKLYKKLFYVKPKHVEFEPFRYEEEYDVSLGHRFDVIEGDVENLDTNGFHVIIDP